MTVEVKICGLKTEAALEAALAAGADYVGLVFCAGSPRNLDLETARRLAQRARGRARIVALLVDPDDKQLEDVVTAAAPDIIQLHGGETPQRVAEVAKRFGRPVLKAIKVAVADDVLSARSYAGKADRILFDARPPREATRPGGLGAAFDWHVLEKLDLQLPFMVSGGLTAENVAEAVRVTRAGGVDISSGVERAPGVKDPDMIRAFIRAARATEELMVR